MISLIFSKNHHDQKLDKIDDSLFDLKKNTFRTDNNVKRKGGPSTQALTK